MSRYTDEELNVKAACVYRWLKEGDPMASMFVMTMSQLTGMVPDLIVDNIQHRTEKVKWKYEI